MTYCSSGGVKPLVGTDIPTPGDFIGDSESESEEEQKREPGDPGTSTSVMDPNLMSPFHNDPSDGDAPDLRHQTTDEHHDEEEDEQIHFVNV